MTGSESLLSHNVYPTKNVTPRRRKKSSGLGRDIHAGDTGPSLGTGLASTHPSRTPSPTIHDRHADRMIDQKRSTKRRSTRPLLRRFKRFAFKHTWTFPLIPLLAFLSLYAMNPTDSNVIHHFIFLSYKQPPALADAGPMTPPQYGKGLWDIAFVAFYTIVLSFTRELITQELLRPLARLCRIRSRGKQFRFMEQMYTAIYFGIMGPVGLYVMQRTPVWYFNTPGMYESFPHRTHEAIFKFFYLFEAAYWAQQAIVMLLGMEKPRKDFKELVLHHIVTLSLIALSYRFHFTYMGIAIYVTHDLSEFFLALSKSMHYIDSPIVGLTFGICVIAWIYLRNYLNLRVILSLFNEFKTVGPYELNWETQQYKCLYSNLITLGLLSALQALNLFWLYCLLRSAYKFVVFNIKKDDRSETDESEPEGLEDQEQERRRVESLRLLNGNGVAKNYQDGKIKATQ